MNGLTPLHRNVLCQNFAMLTLTLLMILCSGLTYASDVFGTFTIDGVPVDGGTVTLYDRNLNAVGSQTTNATGQYRLLYQDPDLYFINAVQGLATTGFQELQLTGGEKNLDLNVLVTLKTVSIKGQVTTQDGFPIGFAALKFGSASGKFDSKSVYSDKFGFYDLKLTMPSFAVNIQLDVRLGSGLGKLSQNDLELTALASKQNYQIEIDKDLLTLDYQVKMPAFAKQTITLIDEEEQPLEGVTTTIFEDNNDRLVSLGKFQSDAQGQVSFYYPVLANTTDANTITSLTIQTLPGESYTGDYEVLWLDDTPDDSLHITYDKRGNSATGIAVAILGHVEVIDEDGSSYRVEAQVSVMDEDFNLLETQSSNANGFYSLSLAHSGDYYIRADSQRGQSPWLKVTALQDEVVHNVTINPRQNIIDISGTVKTQNGQLLGGVSLGFSTAHLPASIYQMGGENDPRVITGESGRYVISLVGNEQPGVDAINYEVSNDDSEAAIYLNGAYRPGYLQFGPTTFTVDASSIETADIVLGDIHALELKTFAPDAKAYGLEIDVYRVNGDQAQFLLRVDTIIGKQTVYLPAKNVDGTTAVYRVRPQVPTNLQYVWLPPQIADFSLISDAELVVIMAKQGETDQRMITVTGKVTDLNNQALGGMTIGFSTVDIATDDYTRAYEGYYPHQSTTQSGEYIAKLRAKTEATTRYTTLRQTHDNGAPDKWANIQYDGRSLEAWLGGFTVEQPLVLGAEIANDQLNVPIQLPVAFHHVQLTVKDTSGNLLSNLPVTLYWLDDKGDKYEISSEESNSAGLVELYLPGEQGRSTNIQGFVFKLSPRSSNVVTMTAPDIHFNVTDKAMALDGAVTIVEKYYATLSGTITDANGLLLQDLSMGVRSNTDKGWYDGDTTDSEGRYDFQLRVMADSETTFDIKNHRSAVYASNWSRDDYYDYWAKVSDGSGQYFAWARGAKLFKTIAIPSNQQHYDVESLQLPVALKKVNLSVKSDQGELQVGTKVEFHFKNNLGVWSHQQTLKTNSWGIVSIYLPALTDTGELYRFVTKPLSSTSNGQYTQRIGAETPFTGNEGDSVVDLDSTVTIAVKDRRYVNIKGKVTDLSGIVLEDVSMGARYSNSMSDTDSTINSGEFILIMEALPDATTSFEIKNHRSPRYNSYWQDPKYFDDWAKVPYEGGYHWAWLKDGQYFETVDMPLGDDVKTIDVKIPVTLKRLNVQLNGSLDNTPLTSTKVDIEYRNRSGQWSLVKTLTTNSAGLGAIFLPVLNNDGELYRFTTKPTGTTKTDGYIIREGETLEFTLSDTDTVKLFESVVKETVQARRYVRIKGVVTDLAGLALQDVLMGARYSNDWFDSSTTTTTGEFSFNIEALPNETTNYELKNHDYPGVDSYWQDPTRFDYWALIPFEGGYHYAWLKDGQFTKTVDMSTDKDVRDFDVKIPVTLKRLNIILKNSRDNTPQVSTSVDIEFKDRYGDWSQVKSLTTNNEGMASIFLPVLTDSDEMYRFSTNPTNTTTSDGYILRTGETRDFTITNTDTVKLLNSVVTETVEGRRYVTINGTVTDLNDLVLQGVTMGARYSSDWHTASTTTSTGEFSMTMEALPTETTSYEVKSHTSPGHYWQADSYFDEWAEIPYSGGFHPAWLKDGRYSEVIDMTLDKDVSTIAVKIPVALKRLNVVLKGSLNNTLQVNTPVDIEYRDQYGDWSLVKSLITNSEGLAAIFLPTLNVSGEMYRFTTKPKDTTLTDGYIFREGETQEFTLSGAGTVKLLESVVAETVKGRRYVTIKGTVKDLNGLVLQDVTVGARYSRDWFDVATSTNVGEFSLNMEALPDASTPYELKNHSYPSGDTQWDDSQYFDNWALVPFDGGQHPAWLKNGQYATTVEMIAGENVKNVVVNIPVTLKRFNVVLTGSLHQTPRADTIVDIEFRNRYGDWSLVKRLTTNSEGTVAIFLPTLSGNGEMYRYSTRPTNTTTADGYILRTGETREFTITAADKVKTLESVVSEAVKARHYVNITGTVTDLSGVILQDVTMGARYDRHWSDGDKTTAQGKFSLTMEALPDASTRYELKNHKLPGNTQPYWDNPYYFDHWAKVPEGEGYHHAWLKGGDYTKEVNMPKGQEVKDISVKIPVTLKRLNLVLTGSLEGNAHSGTAVDIEFRNRFGDWTLLANLTTNSHGYVTMFLPVLTLSEEMFRFTTKPTDTTTAGGYIIRTGETREFTISDADTIKGLKSIVTETAKERRYITIGGTVTDLSGIVLQNVTMSGRNSFDWYDTDKTTVTGQFSLAMEALPNETNKTEIKNHNSPRYSSDWSNPQYFDEWAAVPYDGGAYWAWLKGGHYSSIVEIPLGENVKDVNVQLPLTLKRTNVVVTGSLDNSPQITVPVVFEFKNQYGDWTELQTLNTDNNGMVTLYLPVLTNSAEQYRFTTKPTGSTSPNHYISRQGETRQFTINDTDTTKLLESVVIETQTPRRYINIKGTVTDMAGVILRNVEMGARYSADWNDTSNTNTKGEFSFNMEALPDATTSYEVKNHTYPGYTDSYWTNPQYFDVWAGVLFEGEYLWGWLKDGYYATTVAMPLDKDVEELAVKIPVTLKRLDVVLTSSLDGSIQKNIPVDIEFRNQYGDWTLLKALTTNNKGMVNMYLPVLSVENEMYRFTTKPTGSTTADNYVQREGEVREFTINDTDTVKRIESLVTETVTTRRYIQIKGIVTDLGGVVLKDVVMGARYSRDWSSSNTTTNVGEFSMTMEALANTTVRYELKNHTQSYWDSPLYYDDWALVPFDGGDHHAWLKDGQYSTVVELPPGEDVKHVDVEIPVTLKRVNVVVKDNLNNVALAGIAVDIEYSNQYGDWSLVKALTTNSEGIATMYLPVLSIEGERYRYVTKPIDSTTTDAYTYRTGESVEFELSENNTIVDIDTTVKVTIQDRRYIDMTGHVTDLNGLLLADLAVGLRTEPAEAIGVWNKSDISDNQGQYSFVVEASEHEPIQYGLKNNSSADNNSRWDSVAYHDYWATIEQNQVSYDAWLRDAMLYEQIVVAPDLAQPSPYPKVTQNLVAPVALHKFTTQAKDKNGYPLAGITVDYDFNNAFGIKSDLKRVAVGSSGEYALFLPDLETAENYLVTITDNGFYGFEPSEVYTYQLAQDKTLLNVVNFTDDQAPTFVSNPYVSYQSDVSALIVWFTDEPSKSIVSVNGQNFSDNALVKRHTVLVNGLTPGEIYTASAQSIDASGNESLLNEITFTTLLEVDSSNPVFTNPPVISQVGATVAVVDFTADEPVTAVVKVKSNGNLISEVVIDQLLVQHQVTLPDLYHLTQYQVEVTITDASHNGPVSGVPLALHTKENIDKEAPQFTVRPIVRNITSTSVTIYWETDKPAISAISYNRRDGGSHIPLRSADLNRVHVQTLTGLVPDQLYDFTVSVTDIFENGPRLSTSQAFYTRTQVDTDAPVLLSDVAVIQLGDSNATLVWSTDEAASGVIRFGETADTLTETLVAPEPNISQQLPLTNLNADTTYFYQLTTTDTVGNELVTEVADFTTKSVGANVPLAYIGLPTLLQVTGQSLTVGLRTNKPAHASLLCYDNNGDVHEGSSVAEHKHQQLVITSLTPANYYQCQVNSWTSNGDSVGSVIEGDTFGSRVIRSLQSKDEHYPMLTEVPTITYLSDSTAMIAWETNELSQTALRYRQSDLARNKAVSTPGYRTKHSQIITGLKADTRYYFWIMSQDIAGNRFSEGRYRINTKEDNDDVPPEFTSTPVITSLSGGMITIDVQASEPVTATVVYLRDDATGRRTLADDNQYRLSHQMVLNFTPDNDYKMWVKISDLNGQWNIVEEVMLLPLKTDHDGDGLTDAFESVYGDGPVSMLALADNDGDGLTNLQEQNLGLDPLNSDTDGDGVADGEDEFPLNGAESSDEDGDGIGDNADSLNDLLGQAFVFDEMVPNLTADWYFNQVVGSAVNGRGLVSILEYHGETDLRLKLYNASDSGRMTVNKQLGGFANNWQKVAGIHYFNNRWHIIAMHQIYGANVWYWHQLTQSGHYLTDERVTLDGVPLTTTGIADVQVTPDGLSLLVLEDNQLNLRLLNDEGEFEDNFILWEVDVTSNLHFSQNSTATLYAIGADSGDCGTIWLYDQQGSPSGTITVGDYQQNRCGVLQDIVFLENDNILIDAQTELYQVDNQGGLVHQTITNQTGNKPRYLSANWGRRYLVTDGVMRQYDSNLKQVANYSAFSARNGYFVDEYFSVHADPYTDDSNHIYTLERNIARVQLFDFDTLSPQRFVRSFTLKDKNNRWIDARDMVMAQVQSASEPRLFVIENTETQAQLHSFTQQGGWGGVVALPSGFAKAIHYQNAHLYILARDTFADTNTAKHMIWQYNINNNSLVATWSLAGISAKALDIAGDGSELFLLHQSVGSVNKLSVGVLNNTGEVVVQHQLVRLRAGSDVANKAKISADQTRLLVSYGPRLYLHQIDDDLTFVQAFDHQGYGGGQNAAGSNLSAEFTAQGKLVWADTAQGRLQVHKRTTVDINAKAIILSGGGDYAGNNLWYATLQQAHGAYRTLRRQGLSKDQIYYLSNEAVDFDGNGQADELFKSVSKANLQQVLEWANDADSLILYMVDHGNVDKFRVQPSEILSAQELSGYLEGYKGKLSMIYDACRSGSFIDDLQGENRTIITSSDTDHDALFLQDGAVSFSGLFWQYVDNGQDLYTAYSESRNFFHDNGFKQNPQLSINGVNDPRKLKGHFIGRGYKYAGAVVSVKSVQNSVIDKQLHINATLDGDVAASQRVWAIVMPTGNAAEDDITSPIVDTPSIDLSLKEDGSYQGQLDVSMLQGSQYIAVMVQDNKGNKSLPKRSYVYKNTAKQAILVAAYQDDNQQERVNQQLLAGYNALIQQGYSSGQIKVLTKGISEADDDSTIESLETALNTWAIQTQGDLFVYIAGDMDRLQIRLKGEPLTAQTLVGWLDAAAVGTQGQLTVMLDGDGSGGFASKLTGFTQPPYIMATTNKTQQALWWHHDFFSFSQVFFAEITKGEITIAAYIQAKRLFRKRSLRQTSYIDSNDDGVTVHQIDGAVLNNNRHTIGRGLMLAGDEPLIGSVNTAFVEAQGGEFEGLTFEANNITSTSDLDEVYAYITMPSTDEQPLQITKVALTADEQGQYRGFYGDLAHDGDYLVLYFARNVEGYISLLAEHTQSAVTVNDNDMDNDGMDDQWELAHSLSPEDSSDADQDLDGDGLTNLEEFLSGSNPTTVDTDADGVNDNLDVEPLNNKRWTNIDTDGDGFTDDVETVLGFDINNAQDVWVDDDGDHSPVILERMIGLNETVKDNNVFANPTLLIHQAHIDILHRIATPDEINPWLELLQTKAATPVDVYAELLNEGNVARLGFIGRVYLAILTRAADLEGIRYYNTQLQNTMSEQDMVAALVGSAEFQARYGNLSNLDFVKLVYSNVLKREADVDGLVFWQNRLDSGDYLREQMMLEFINSAEYITNNDAAQRITVLNQLLTGQVLKQQNAAQYQQWLQDEGHANSALRAILANNDYRQTLMGASSNANADLDKDGIPDGVEFVDNTDVNSKDNDIDSSDQLFVKQALRDMVGEVWSLNEINAQSSALRVAGSRGIWLQSLLEHEQLKLKRQPEYNGLMYWISRFESGAALTDIADYFASSTEFFDLYGDLSNNAFIKLVYLNVLQREADSDGLSYWEGRLSSAEISKGGLMTLFSESAENQANAHYRGKVVLLFNLLYRRAANDDEFNRWHEDLRNGTDSTVLIETLINSAE